MDVIGNISPNRVQTAGVHAAAPPSAMNISQIANRVDYDLSSFYIDKNTPISFHHFDFNDRSHEKIADESCKTALEAMRLKFKEKYEGKAYRDDSVGTYRLSHKYPLARGKDYYPLAFDINGNNIMIHASKLAVVLSSIANCNLQIVPLIKQLKLLGKMYPDIQLANNENFYQLCSQVRVSSLNQTNFSFHDVKELARQTAQNGDDVFNGIPIVVMGDGIKPGSVFANSEAHDTCKRLNIRILACRDENDKNITLDCLQKLYDTEKDDRIKNIRVCTWAELDKPACRSNDHDAPDVRYIQASSDTIATHAKPALNLRLIENDLSSLLSFFYIDKDTPIRFDQFNFNDLRHRNLPELFMRRDLEEIRRELTRNYADGRFPYTTVREYLAYTSPPEPDDIDYRPEVFDPYSDNNVTHGTNLDVVTHAIINCGLQLVPGITQLLLLGKQHDITFKANPELTWLLNVAVRATTLRALHSKFWHAEELALAAAQETTNILSAIPVVVIGEGVNERDMHANQDNEFAYARVNIWILALKDDIDKKIVMTWLAEVRDKLGIAEIDSLMFCTFKDINDCQRKNGRPIRPDLAALMAKSHTLA